MLETGYPTALLSAQRAPARIGERSWRRASRRLLRPLLTAALLSSACALRNNIVTEEGVSRDLNSTFATGTPKALVQDALHRKRMVTISDTTPNLIRLDYRTAQYGVLAGRNIIAIMYFDEANLLDRIHVRSVIRGL